jgi:hypothetical protein
MADEGDQGLSGPTVFSPTIPESTVAESTVAELGDDGLPPTDLYAQKWLTSLKEASLSSCVGAFFCGCEQYAKNRYRMDLLDRHQDDPELADYQVCNVTCWEWVAVCIPSLGR